MRGARDWCDYCRDVLKSIVPATHFVDSHTASGIERAYLCTAHYRVAMSNDMHAHFIVLSGPVRL